MSEKFVNVNDEVKSVKVWILQKYNEQNFLVFIEAYSSRQRALEIRNRHEESTPGYYYIISERTVDFEWMGS